MNDFQPIRRIQAGFGKGRTRHDLSIAFDCQPPTFELQLADQVEDRTAVRQHLRTAIDSDIQGIVPARQTEPAILPQGDGSARLGVLARV